MPTLTSSQLVQSNAVDNSTLTTTSVSFSAGDVVIVKAASEGTLQATSITATGLTFTKVAEFVGTGSNAGASIWAATAGSGTTTTVAVAFVTGSSNQHSIVMEQWASASLAGTPATNATQTGTGAPSTTLTTTANGSTVTWVDADWSAQTGTPSYRSSATQDGVDDKSPSNYVAWFAYQSAATAGSQTMGMTAPTGQTWTLVGIEVLASGGTDATVIPPARVDVLLS